MKISFKSLLPIAAAVAGYFFPPAGMSALGSAAAAGTLGSVASGSLSGQKMPQMPQMVMPREVSAPVVPKIDQARLKAEQAEGIRRKKGRAASLLTGPEGVGSVPVSQRTLIGS